MIDRLKGILSIEAIKSKAEIVANTQKAMEALNNIIVFMILGAGILAFAVIYNIANINIFERRREIATLSVLGFNSGELKSLVFNENYFISALGIIGGILPGRLFLQYVVAMQNTDEMQMPVVLGTPSCLIAAALLIVFTITANWLLGKKVTSINMVESLKSAE